MKTETKQDLWLYVLVISVLVLLMLAMAGCAIVDDGAGGKSIQIGVTPATHKNVQDGLDTTRDLLGGLSAFFPVLAPFATAAGVGGVTWRRMKKTVTKNKDPLKMLVAVLDDIKKNDAKTWAKVKAKIQKENPTVDVKGTIEEIKLELAKQAELAEAA